MQSSIFSTALLALASALSVDALGIDCEGSAKCSFLWTSGNVAKDITNVINSQIDPNRWYYNGQQIACFSNQAGNGGGYCAFLQNTGGTWGSVIKNLAHYIPDHGYQICGSVPYYYPGDSNVANGELTYNFVDMPCGTWSSGTHMC